MQQIFTRYTRLLLLFTFGCLLGSGSARAQYTMTTLETGGYYSAVAVDKNDDVYVTRFTGSAYEIAKYTNGTGTPTVIYDQLTYGPGALPWGLAVNDNGVVFVTNPNPSNSWEIIRLTPGPGGYTADVVQSGTWFSALAKSRQNALVTVEYLSSPDRYRMRTLQPGQEDQPGSWLALPITVHPGATASWPWGIAMDATNNYYVLDLHENNGGQIIRMNAAGGYTTHDIVASGGYYSALALDNSGYFYTTEHNGTDYRVVKRADITQPTGEVLLTGLNTDGLSVPWGLAVNSKGEVFVGDGSSATGGRFVKLTPPGISVNVTRTGTSPTNAAIAQFTVTFSGAANNVTPSAFSLFTSGTIAGAGITSVAAVNSTTYIVTANTGTGDGQLRLDVSGTGMGNIITNAPYTSGEVYTIDKTGPAVTGVNVPANGYYKAGDVLSFAVQYNEALTVNTAGGTPYLGLVLGSGTVQAVYTGGSGTNTHTFSYTVQAGDMDMDGVALGSDIVLNGGVMQDAVGNNIQTALQNVSPTNNVFVNTASPTVVLSTTASSPVNQQFAVTVTFSEAVAGLVTGDFSTTNASLSGLSTINNITYTVTVTPAADGSVTLSLPAGAAQNIGNNDSQASNTLTLTYDNTAPAISTVAVPAAGTYTGGDVLTFTVNYNEAVVITGGTPSLPVTIGSAPVQALYTGGSGTTSLTFVYTVQNGQSDNDGIAVGTQLGAGGATLLDAAGNNASLTLAGVQPTANVLVDATAPVVNAVNVPANGYYNAGTVLDFTIDFSEDVHVTGTPYISVIIGAVTRQAPYTGGTGTGTLTFAYTVQDGDLDMDGIAITGNLALNGGSAKDNAGNNAVLVLNNIGNTSNVFVNTISPTVVLSAPPALNAPFTLTATFSEAVTGFDIADLIATNATLSNLQTSDNISYTVLVTPVADGMVSISVPASAAVNIGQNGNQASNVFSYTYDGTAPVVTSVDVPANDYYGTGEHLDFTVHFSENVTVTGTPAISVTIGSATVAAAYTGGGSTNALTFRYTVQNGDLDMDGIAIGGALALNSGTVKDAAGNNAVLMLNSIGNTSNVFVNTIAPTVVLSGTPSPNAPFTLTATFSEAVTGFALDDFTVTNATLSNLQTSDNISYTVLVTPVAEGSVIIFVPAGIARNIGQNDNQASNAITYTYDGTAPVVTSVDVPADGYYGTGEQLDFTVHFSEDVIVTGVPGIGITIGSATVTAAYTGGTTTNALTFRYTVQNGDLDMDGIALNGNLILNSGTIEDLAGNNAVLALNNTGNTSNVFVNTIVPTVVLSGTPSPNAPFTLTATFSEAVTGFALADFTATNATLSNLQTSDNMVYTVLVTPVTEGAVNISVPANVAMNTGQNGNQASNVISYTYDGAAPVVTSVDVPANGYYGAGEHLDFTVHFSENVTVTGTPGISVTIGSATVTAAYTGGSSTNALTFRYTVQNGDLDMDGIAIGSALALNSGTVKDAVGNNAVLTLNNTGNTSNVFVNTIVPTVVLSGTPSPNAPFTLTATFSEAVTGFALADFTATNATLSNLQTSDNMVYTVLVTPVTEGAVNISVPANVAMNTGQNGNQASNVISYTYDGAAPVVTSVDVPANGYYGAGEHLDFAVHFSENVTVTGTPGISVTIGSAIVTAAYTGGSTTNALTFRYTVQNGDLDMDGIAIGGNLALNSGTVKDAAGNNAALMLNSIGNTSNIFVNTQRPTVTLSSTATGRVNTPATITLIFSEAVTGLTAGDILVTNGTASSLQTTDGITYTAVITPTADGAVSVNLPVNVAENIAGNGNDASNTVSFTYDATAPVINAGQSFTINQYSPNGTEVGQVNATAGTDALQNWAIATDGSGGALEITGTGMLRVKDVNLLGPLGGTTLTLQVTVSDGLNTSAPVPVSVQVTFVNQAPTLGPIANVSHCPDTETHTIQLTGASATEPAQTYTIAATASQNIFDLLTVNASNMLSYRLKANTPAGSATITVTIKDNGGTLNGGTDTLRRTFTVTVTSPPAVSITSDKGTSVSKGETVRLTASGGVTYLWTDADGIIGGRQSAILEIRPQANTTYEVITTNAAGCAGTGSIDIAVVNDFKVDATNILTPNGDGRNDRWVIRNLDSYPDNEVKIFDRAGRMVYQRRNYSNEWDGTVNGSPLAEGTYYYILTINGGQATTKGYITIVRDRK